MATAGASPSLKVSKTTLSMFLRTRCDKELFLSLHDKKHMASAGLPAPIKRPGIGILAVEGKEFELDRNDSLVRLFPGMVDFSKTSATYNDMDLHAALSGLTTAPRLILQGSFSVAGHQSAVLSRIGLSAADQSLIPPLADYIPDVVLVRDGVDGDLEVRPDGTRQVFDELLDDRRALVILDIKHTAESNPSYCSEIALYAVMLANWLQLHPNLARHYFVCSKAYLWTRVKQGESRLSELEQKDGATPAQLLDALVEDSEDAQLRFYLASIRRFFEDVARVVRIGHARPQGWQDLDWHVSGSCGSCDWLGDKRHMGQSERTAVDAQPSHYCMPSAAASGHLCLVPGVTRGAKKVLYRNTVQDTTALAGAVGHAAFQQHTLLKREAKTLPARSAAIQSDALTTDPDSIIASLVSSANLLLYASVNFDSSAGLLTGLALSGVATNFTPGQPPRRFGAVPFVVDQKTLAAEWFALEGFLSQIASCIDVAEKLVGSDVAGQIHFWEQRQFVELCNAMGRHLPRVMALGDKRAKALAWVFAPESMLARPESLAAATVVAVDEVVRRLVFAPTKHVITLFDTVDHYRRSAVSPAERDSYYREYLSNGIPRERIYEIWSNATMVKRGATNAVPRNTVISQYSDALEKQSRALEAVCEKLREDYRGKFRAKATRIPTSIPQGARSVAFDGKLWLWFDELEFNASQLEAHMRLSMDGERLEAGYEAIVLLNGVHLRDDHYVFDVRPSSSEAKFREDARLTLGKLGEPGMPLQHGRTLVRSGAPFYAGDADMLSRPLWSIINARLVTFDRVRNRAEVQLSVRDEEHLVPYLIANSVYSLLHEVFLVEPKSPSAFNWAEQCSPILRAIGTPKIAQPDRNAAAAIGVSPPKSKTVSPETPAARVLWNAAALESKVVVPAATARSVASDVRQLDELNDSQEEAAAFAIERGLTLIWGPPGTGKTKTLAAIIHGMARQAAATNQPLRVLVTGPTYKAVEEVMERAARNMGLDANAPGSLYMGYSASRAAGKVPTGLAGHVSYNIMDFDQAKQPMQNCIAALALGSGVTIAGCHISQARRFPKYVADAAVAQVFDVVVIDESSQVQVSRALAALAGLRDDARLIVAGDHLQMPPIASVEPPADAAYLVGSIQTYLTDRKFSAPLNSRELQVNYRSGAHIVEFARSIGYPQSLQPQYPDARLHRMTPLPPRSLFPVHLPWSDDYELLLRPETVVATLLHEDDVSSQGNEFEAGLVTALVVLLRLTVSADLHAHGNAPPNHRVPTAAEFWGKCVGVVTPHRAQRALVVRELEKVFPTEANLIADAVDTVERFQGGERHTIIVTFGVADVDVIGGEEAFLMQLQRTNVAVSRAMGKCIVVMPDALAAHIPEDKRALATAHALKDYVEEFCNVRVGTSLQLGAENRPGQIRYRG